MAAKPRILTGDRPTGKMHLGHYVGTLADQVKLRRRMSASSWWPTAC
jgi:tryptophanyl-tRNA synthetase